MGGFGSGCSGGGLGTEGGFGGSGNGSAAEADPPNARNDTSPIALTNKVAVVLRTFYLLDVVVGSAASTP